MYETYITNETAKLAKEKGFDVPTIGYFIECFDGWKFGLENPEDGEYNWNERAGRSAPTQAVLQTWIRIKYRIHIEIYCNASGWGYILTKLNGTTIKEIEDDVFFEEPEQALETGLILALNMNPITN